MESVNLHFFAGGAPLLRSAEDMDVGIDTLSLLFDVDTVPVEDDVADEVVLFMSQNNLYVLIIFILAVCTNRIVLYLGGDRNESLPQIKFTYMNTRSLFREMRFVTRMNGSDEFRLI